MMELTRVAAGHVEQVCLEVLQRHAGVLQPLGHLAHLSIAAAVRNSPRESLDEIFLEPNYTYRYK